MRHRSHAREAGFTLVELLVALALFAIVIGNIYSILGKSATAAKSQSRTHDTEDQARRLLDRIANEVVGAYEESLEFVENAPLASHDLTYSSFLGFADDAPEFSAPRRIALAYESGWLLAFWENPGGSNERRVVWSKWVPELFEGEDSNGTDDNENGLIDEPGLSFVRDGRIVKILLTLRRTAPDGTPTTKTLSAEVAVRN